MALSLIADAVSDLVSVHVAQGRAAPEGARDGALEWAVEAAMFGAGPLQPLLEDEDLENLDLNGCDEVWATYASRGRVQLPPVADSDEELVDILRALASYAGPVARPWSTVHPQLDLGLPGGVRVSGLLAASERPQVSIRRDRLGPQAFLDVPPRRYPDAISLVELGTLDPQCAAFLAAAVRARANVLIVGATNAGKTTLLRAMANEVPVTERIISIEQARELRLGRDASLHSDVVELETVLASPDGAGGLDGADLVRRSKRMNPDRLIFGEVLAGAEARAMLEAMLQGGDGSMSTIHARHAYGAIARLIIGLGSLREPIQPATAAALIGQAIDFVVHVRRRVVTEVLEISGHQGETVSHATIFAAPEIDETFVAEFAAGEEAPRPGREGSTVAAGVAAQYDQTVLARRDTRIPLKRAALLARHGYTDEMGERLNADRSRVSRGRQVPAGSSSNSSSSSSPQATARASRPADPERPAWMDIMPLGRSSSAGESEPTAMAAQSDAASGGATGFVEDIPGHRDPAGIPEPLLNGSWTGQGSDVTGRSPDAFAGDAGVPEEVVRARLGLPADGRSPDEPIIHRRRPEPLALDTFGAPGTGKPTVVGHGVDDDPFADPPRDAGTWSSGRNAEGPIIDMGARRPAAGSETSASGSRTGWPGLEGQGEGTSRTGEAVHQPAAPLHTVDSGAALMGPHPGRRSRRERASTSVYSPDAGAQSDAAGTPASGLGFPLTPTIAADPTPGEDSREPERKLSSWPRSQS
ncbi:CpaF family protein [Kineosporia babensis]|uniref:Flp pilus assembly complex ATPase component TadA n=1 Tax=Kineosporia babensis TaxID=499548 RepID=A0A9X1NN86_9ACTN|nr:ATPase, T2SS/T4P/T4SS family [Kineosporia babensis]MCD5316844.1 Flp pilus assembly complex ATPase component TadA [Kineosporia babensis]